MENLKWGLRWVVVLALVFGAVSEARIPDKQYLPPKLQTVHDQSVFLGFLSRELPELFAEGTEYDVDLFQFLANQQVAVEHLEQLPAYKKALKERDPLLEIEVNRHVKVKAKTTFILQSWLIEAVKGKWKEIDLNPEEGIRKNMKKAVAEAKDYLDEFPSLKLRGALTGLISLLPTTVRGALFRKFPADQIKMLRSDVHFGELEAKWSSFRFKDVGLQTMGPTALLSVLEEANQHVESIKKHLLLAAASEFLGANATGSTSPQAVLSEMFVEKRATTEAISEAGIPLLNELWKEIEQSALAKVSGDEMPGLHTVLRLKEAPGYLATLRGFVGVDCATQYSFPYGLLPKERTFFVIDPEGTVLGYVMATEVQWENSRAIYLHDFSGPRISPTMVQYTIAGLLKAFQDLQYEVLVLPTPQISHRNVNFKHIRAEMDRIAATGTLGTLSYLDGDLRKRMQSIAHFAIEHGYDSPEANRQGHAISQFELDGLDIETRRADWPDVGSASLTNAESVFLALEVDFPVWSHFAQGALQAALNLTEQPNSIALQRRNAAYQLLEAAGLATYIVDSMAAALPNYSGLTGVDFLNEVDPLLRTLELSVDDLLAGHGHLLHPGILNSADVFESPSARVNQIALDAVRAVLLHRNQPELVQPVLAQHFEAFMMNPEFPDLVNDLVRDRLESLRSLQWFLANGMDPVHLSTHLARIQEIASHSVDSMTSRTAASLVKTVSFALHLDSRSCSDLLIPDATPKKKR